MIDALPLPDADKNEVIPREGVERGRYAMAKYLSYFSPCVIPREGVESSPARLSRTSL